VLKLPWARREDRALPFTPVVEPEAPTVTTDERYYMASQWKLMWWRFRKHKIAVASLIVIIGLYLIALFAGFLAPYGIEQRNARFTQTPPQRIHLRDGDRFVGPYVYGLTRKQDPQTLRRFYEEDKAVLYPLQFFAKGEPYKLFGLIQMDRRLFGVGEGGTAFLLGTDDLGRDLFSRLLYGSQISLSIGLVGVALSLVLGIILGGVSGFYGGTVDLVIQRVIEMLRSFPSIPLWLALSAALPPHWSIIKVYFGITVILSFLGWTDVARVVRGKLLSLREEDFTMAARIAGVREWEIIMRHLLPSFMSQLIVIVTIAIPGMVLAETSLSFLGLGLRPPVVSWGVLLQQAQNIRAVALQPWLLTPVILVIVTVLTFNFLGDGLRDAADPYAV
jgi:peptide/nickel transport system permease protein